MRVTCFSLQLSKSLCATNDPCSTDPERIFSPQSYGILVIIRIYIWFAELHKLEGSKVVVSSTKTTVKHKGQIIAWPYHVKCGICGVERQVDNDRKHAGILKKFRAGMAMGICFISWLYKSSSIWMVFLYFDVANSPFLDYGKQWYIYHIYSCISRPRV